MKISKWYNNKKIYIKHWFFLKLNFRYFCNIPKNELTQDMCEYVFNYDIRKICYIPYKYQTKTMYKKILTDDVTLITYIDSRFLLKNKKMYKKMCEKICAKLNGSNNVYHHTLINLLERCSYNVIKILIKIMKKNHFLRVKYLLYLFSYVPKKYCIGEFSKYIAGPHCGPAYLITKKTHWNFARHRIFRLSSPNIILLLSSPSISYIFNIYPVFVSKIIYNFYIKNKKIYGQTTNLCGEKLPILCDYLSDLPKETFIYIVKKIYNTPNQIGKIESIFYKVIDFFILNEANKLTYFNNIEQLLEDFKHEVQNDLVFK